MIPGNRPEDLAFERLHEKIDEDCLEHGWDGTDAMIIWHLGLMTYPEVERLVELAHLVGFQDATEAVARERDEAGDLAAEARGMGAGDAPLEKVGASRHGPGGDVDEE
jgi:hypothetical protein